MLTPAQIDHYQQTGALVVPGLLDDITRQRMKRVLQDLVEASRKVSAHDLVYDLEPGHTRDNPQVRRIKKPHEVNAVFNEFIRNERMLEVLRDLVGPSLRLHGSKLNLKAPYIGSPVEWHQDWAFYPHTNDDLLAVGVMLDDTTIENGAMYVIPGTHRGPTFDHHDDTGVFAGSMDIERCPVDPEDKVACVGPAGSCSFHHVRVVHGSPQNTSSQSRGLLLYEVAAADAFPLLGIADYADYRARLLCGQESIEPRMADVPVRMPLPPAKNQGSIYENQRAGKRYFGFVNSVAR